MGSAADYVCENCRHRAKGVTDDFDCGFSGAVTTPVVCKTHGILPAQTGLQAFQDGWTRHKRKAYPCPECQTMSRVWDRHTCPACGSKTMVIDSEGGFVCWD